MRSIKIRRAALVPAMAAAVLALALPLASQAASIASTKAASPHVATGGVSHVTGTSAVLNGRIDPHGLATTYYFQYGPTIAYGQQTAPASLTSTTKTTAVSQTVTGMLSGYHYRLIATNADGTQDGHDRTFSGKSKSRKVAFELPKTFEPVALGGAFTLSGTLTGTGNAYRPVVLQSSQYPYSAPFADVGSPILTSASGAFTFRVAKLSSATKFRVATVGSVPVYSAIVPEQVTVRVALKVRLSSRRGLVRLYGTVTPAEVGARVFFQLEKPPKAHAAPKGVEKPIKVEKVRKGSSEKPEPGPTFATKFSTRVKAGTRAISRFSAVVDIATTGRYRAYVEVTPGRLSSGHSPSITLHAPAPTKATAKSHKRT